MKSVHEDFMKLIETILGIKDAGGRVDNIREPLMNAVGKLNNLLKLSGKPSEFVAETEGQMIGPLPFHSTDQPFRFVFFGLNPKYAGDVTVREKRAAKNEWTSYTHFYNNNSKPERIAPFHRNITMLINTILSEKFIGWGEFKKGLNKEDTIRHYVEFIGKYPFGVGEFIPFYSNNTDAVNYERLQEIYNEMPELKAYHTLLIESLSAHMADDCCVVTNGKGITDMFLNAEEKNLIKLGGDKKLGYTLHNWRGRPLIALHQFLRVQGGLLNRYEDIARMVDNVRDTFKDNGISLPRL
ncbi:hypothetical protein ACFQI7_25760 [Paenibacillus allorhizosphaerae]|uniref:Uncharacterized protein n=1 Tax=Paenibacillus allorhizosphaerae TaxID=2849866 RepID=A0ABN7TLH0_9BACL|nr:hypothetical protein [Paenibacillus allorhizosphaerae]CAG7645485.1 hypothetical protein PAECIP111802_03528 [Paenibacillus allorhizosphaerae]